MGLSLGMTVIDASCKIYEWFSANDSFTENDFIKILPISETPEADRACVLAGLDEFEKMNIVKKINFKNNNYWVLSKSLSSFDQTISITSNTAMVMSQLLNQYCEITGAESEKCDPKNITEKDLKNILFLLTEMTLDKVKKSA